MWIGLGQCPIERIKLFQDLSKDLFSKYSPRPAGKEQPPSPHVVACAYPEWIQIRLYLREQQARWCAMHAPNPPNRPPQRERVEIRVAMCCTCLISRRSCHSQRPWALFWPKIFSRLANSLLPKMAVQPLGWRLIAAVPTLDWALNKLPCLQQSRPLLLGVPLPLPFQFLWLTPQRMPNTSLCSAQGSQPHLEGREEGPPKEQGRNFKSTTLESLLCRQLMLVHQQTCPQVAGPDFHMHPFHKDLVNTELSHTTVHALSRGRMSQPTCLSTISAANVQLRSSPFQEMGT